MPSFDLNDVEKRAELILDQQPDPLVEWKLLTDVLRLGRRSSRVRSARGNIDESRWISELASEQRSDGSWGRFHSADATGSQLISTTESGVERAVTLGLPEDHQIVSSVRAYLESLLSGHALFPDPPERNPRWQIGVLLFTTATLAQLDSGHTTLDNARSVWSRIVSQAFATGDFDQKSESEAYRKIANLSGSLGYLQIRNRYTVALLGSCPASLDLATGQAYLRWLYESERGLGYIGIDPTLSPSQLGRALDRWLSTLELLSLYPAWKQIGLPTIETLWSCADENGLWDFGPRANAYNLHFSEDWRRRQNRAFDHSTRILALFRRMFD